VFSSSIDFVVHLDRMTEPTDKTTRRQTLEIRAVVPALHDDFSTEPIFVRERVGTPMLWTGATPPGDITERIEREMPAGTTMSHLLERGSSTW
jgi:hypothetical protein